MEQCPRCSSFMNFHMDYSCGNPVIFWKCPCCGYDTRNNIVITSNHVITTDTSMYGYTAECRSVRNSI